MSKRRKILLTVTYLIYWGLVWTFGLVEAAFLVGFPISRLIDGPGGEELGIAASILVTLVMTIVPYWLLRKSGRFPRFAKPYLFWLFVLTPVFWAWALSVPMF